MIFPRTAPVYISEANCISWGLGHARGWIWDITMAAPPSLCPLLGSKREGASGTQMVGVSGTSLCHPVVCTKGSLAENVFEGIVGTSPQKRDYLVLIFNSYP